MNWAESRIASKKLASVADTLFGSLMSGESGAIKGAVFVTGLLLVADLRFALA
jgi:hypothetical protein